MVQPIPDPGVASDRLGEESTVEFLVLGPMTVRRQGADVHVGGVKQRSILGMLVANWGRPVSLDSILEAVYGDDVADGARNSVYTFVSALRRDLGDLVHKVAGGYVLDVQGESIDAHRFETEVRSCLSILHEQPEVAADGLRHALGLWRGHAFADVDGHGWFRPEVTRLSELRLSALEARIDADLLLGRHAELLGELESLTIEHPLREGLRAQQMVALYRSGRQTEALRSYEMTRSYLADEIGIDPSMELRLLEERILAQDPSLDLAVTPTLFRRAVTVVGIADSAALARFDPSARDALVSTTAEEFEQAVGRHDGVSFAQRGTMLYATFSNMSDATEAIEELAVGTRAQHIRVAVDFGDVELTELGDLSGPPLRRTEAMVAAAHPGQVLLSAGAHEALLEEDRHGWMVRSLGTHRISGVEQPQPIMQLVVPGQESEFPPLADEMVLSTTAAARGSVTGYELRELMSSDLAATTYRAYQASVGREVMVTAIDPVWGNQPDFVRRFEVEAQLVTGLHHPHILPVLDYWRDPTGAFLVSPFVGLSNLTQALHEGRLARVEQRRRIIDDIAEALARAHQMGIVHGAISPAAILVDESGHAYIPGAGFLTRLSLAPQVSSSFIAPEVERGEPLTFSADVYALGALVEELLGTSDPVGMLKGIIGIATAAEPERRFASIDQLRGGLASVLGDVAARTSFTSTRNPYKGLAAFNESDAGDFFGRSGIIGELSSMVARNRLVAVVGPSGCGKSSLVNAGLIPAARMGLAGPSDWVTTVMYPGSYPFIELEAALARVAVEDPGSLRDVFDSEAYALVRTLKRIVPSGSRLLLVIDQFEELFSMTRDETARSRFLDALVTLAEDDRSNTHIVLTLRADFFDRPLQTPRFGALLKGGTFPLTSPGEADLAEAIRRPAESVGVVWEPGLVEQVIDDVADAPGVLPLLQYALTEIFAGRDSDRLTLDGYHNAGGVLGALGSHADRVLDGLDADGREITRQLFLRLVAIHTSGELTRRRARVAQLMSFGDPAKITAVLERFGEARLLTFDRDPISRGPTVEVAHEALLTRWPVLVEWIGAAREDLLLQQRLGDAVSEWEENQRDDSYLLGRGRLEQFRSWADTTDLTLSTEETEFLELSERRAEEERARRRRVRRVVMSGFAFAAAVASTLGILALLSRQEATANADLAHGRELTASAFGMLEEDPELSLLLTIESATISELSPASLDTLHHALAAQRKIYTYQWPSEQRLGTDLSAVLSPDGELLVASSGGTYIEVVDLGSRSTLWSRDFGGNGIARATFTRDSAEVVVTYGWVNPGSLPKSDPDTEAQLGIHVIDAHTGDEVRLLPIGKRCGVVSSARAITAIEQSGHPYLVTELGNDSNCNIRGDRRGDNNSTDRAGPPSTLIDLMSGETTRLSTDRRFAGNPPSALISADGRFDAQQSFLPTTGYPPVTIITDRSTGSQVDEVPGWLYGLSDDGRTVLTWDDDGRKTWDLSGGPSGQPLAVRADEHPRDIWISPDGSTVAEVTDARVILWDSHTGEVTDALIAGLGSNGSLSFSEDGRRVAIGELAGGQAVVFDLDIPEEIASLQICPGTVGPVSSVEARGATISVHAFCDEGLNLFLADRESLRMRSKWASAGGRSALSSDGRVVAHQVVDERGFVGSIELLGTNGATATGTLLNGLCWNSSGSGNGCLEFPNPPYPDWVNDLDFSPDGNLLAMAGSESDGLTVWDLRTREIVETPTVTHLTESPNRALDVAFSIGGDSIAVSFGWGHPELWLLSTADWQALSHYQGSVPGSLAPTDNLVFVPNGPLVASDNLNAGVGRIVFLDPDTLSDLFEIRDAHDGAITQLAVNETGTLLASSSLDGFARIWDVESHRLIHEIQVTTAATGVGGVTFLSDDTIAVVNNETATLQLFIVDQDRLLDLAGSRITRSLTNTECATYHIDPCPTFGELSHSEP